MTEISLAVGLTSRYLVIPVMEHQDSIGPMTRTVKDAAHILQAIVGVDSHDNYTSAIPNGLLPDYVYACNRSALSAARIGVPRNAISLFSDNTTGPVIEAFDKAVGVMRAAGATIVENTNFTAAVDYLNSKTFQELTNADFLVNLHRYLGSLTYNPRNITSLAELRDFTQSFPLEGYPARNTDTLDLAVQQSWNNTDPRFWPAYQQYLYYGGEGGVLGALERHDLDAVILPANFASHWAAGVGSPIVTVPMGSYPAGVPIVETWGGLVRSAPNIPYVESPSNGSKLC